MIKQTLLSIYASTCIIVFFLSVSAHTQNTPGWIDFYQENIKIYLSKNRARVEGEYYLQNLTNGSITMKISYPFPVDNDHALPDSIQVEGSTFDRKAKAIHFEFHLQPKEARSFRVAYNQAIFSKTFRYILTTAKYWRQPIKTADFIICTPCSWQCEISYEPDSVKRHGNKMQYYIHKNDFFPKKDLLIFWQDNPERRPVLLQKMQSN